MGFLPQGWDFSPKDEIFFSPRNGTFSSKNGIFPPRMGFLAPRMDFPPKDGVLPQRGPREGAAKRVEKLQAVV